MEPAKVLAVAAASGRVGYVYLERRILKDWRLSRKASEGTEEASAYAKSWIDRLRPDAVVTQKITKGCRKGAKTRDLIEVINTVAANEYLYDVSVTRPSSSPNKYAEAATLAEEFPALRPWVPKPRQLWESEPRETIYFEALVLALQVTDHDGEPQVQPTN